MPMNSAYLWIHWTFYWFYHSTYSKYFPECSKLSIFSIFDHGGMTWYSLYLEVSFLIFVCRIVLFLSSLTMFFINFLGVRKGKGCKYTLHKHLKWSSFMGSKTDYPIIFYSITIFLQVKNNRISFLKWSLRVYKMRHGSIWKY